MSRTKNKLVETIDFELRKSTTYSSIFAQIIAFKVKLTTTDMEIGDMLSWKGPLTAGEIAKFIGLTTGAVTGVIDRLENAGIVKRKNDKTDRRKVIVELVYKGAMKIAKHFDSQGIKNKNFMKKYSETELNIILEFIRKTNEITEEEIENNKIKK